MSTATVGQAFVIDIPSGRETLAWTGEVAAPCDSDTNGYWYCLDCRESPANNMGAARHTTHALVWVCIEHGPETCPDGNAP